MSASTFDLERARLVAAQRLQPEHFDEFQRLAKGIVHGPSFQLLFIDCADSLYRDRVIDSLGEPLKQAKLRASRLPISASLRDAAAFERRLRQHAENAEVVHVLGSGPWFNAVRWDDLNQRRERLAGKAPARLLFWLDAESIAQLARHAQDLWAWRGGVYSFALRPQVTNPSSAPVNAPYDAVIDTRSMAERHRRIVELEHMLNTVPPPSDELRAPLVSELGQLLQSLDEPDQALAHLRQVELPLYRKLGNERAVAGTMGRIAGVLEDSGQFDEALRIYREEVGPVFERLGDARSLAVTRGRIADVLQWRGDLVEAMRVRREEELPVYEQLGDLRARAMSMGKIADALHALGQMDEELRIRREEELPIYLRLGDQNSRAVTMAKIGDILQSRGQLDGALRIWRDEVLPIFERLGNDRFRAVTMGRIANVLLLRGQFDEALRISREEVLPVYERLGALRERMACWVSMASALKVRSGTGDLAEARRLLTAALSDARQMRLPEADLIASSLTVIEDDSLRAGQSD